MVKKSKALVSPLKTHHVPLDIDVFPTDNSDTKKEGVFRTYHNYDGYAPTAAYLGLEGWCLEAEFGPGSRHSRKGFIPFLDRVIKKAKGITKKQIVVRPDAGHDSVETGAVLVGRPGVSYILKRNPRKVSRAELASKVFREGKATKPGSGKRVGLITVKEEQEYKGKRYGCSKVIRVTERAFDRKGRLLLLPEIGVEGWRTNMELPEGEVIKLYGSIELAPLIGLADAIVDIVETGSTMRENGLKVAEDIMDSSAHLIANPNSYYAKKEAILDLYGKIQTVVSSAQL